MKKTLKTKLNWMWGRTFIFAHIGLTEISSTGEIQVEEAVSENFLKSVPYFEVIEVETRNIEASSTNPKLTEASNSLPKLAEASTETPQTKSLTKDERKELLEELTFEELRELASDKFPEQEDEEWGELDTKEKMIDYFMKP